MDPSWIRKPRSASTRVSIYLPKPLQERLERARQRGHDINISAVCQSAIRRALDRLEKLG